MHTYGYVKGRRKAEEKQYIYIYKNSMIMDNKHHHIISTIE
jgi:hypothetical protein